MKLRFKREKLFYELETQIQVHKRPVTPNNNNNNNNNNKVAYRPCDTTCSRVKTAKLRKW